MSLLARLALITSIPMFLAACGFKQYDLTVEPNYDYLIGKSFSDSIFKGRKVYKKIGETEMDEELENRRADGCILVFGVRKATDLIQYWRIDSGPNTCKVRKNGLNV